MYWLPAPCVIGTAVNEPVPPLRQKKVPLPSCGVPASGATFTASVLVPAGDTVAGMPLGNENASSCSAGPGRPWSVKAPLISL